MTRDQMAPTPRAHTPSRGHRFEGDVRSRLDSIKARFKGGQLDDHLLGETTELQALIRQQPRMDIDDPFLYLKSGCWIAETLDYFGHYHAARDAAERGASMLDNMPRHINKNSSRIDLEIARERVRFQLAYAQAFLYRQHLYADAMRMILRCKGFVRDRLRSSDFPCNGTLGQIAYYLGRVHRQMSEYDQAEAEFGEALRYYSMRLDHKVEQYADDPQRCALERVFVQHQSAVCLALGLGWLKYTTGKLTEALSLVLPARTVLAGFTDPLNLGYVNLIYGSILRCEAARDKDRLHQAIALVEASMEQLAVHGAFRARAAYELSLAHFFCREYDEATKHANFVKEYSEEHEDHRWFARAIVLQSRIRCDRGEADEAEGLATAALSEARNHDQRLVQIDALLARCESRRCLNRFDDALRDVQEALSLQEQSGNRNPKIEAVGSLYVARLYALLTEPAKATHHYNIWLDLSSHVEHKTIHELAADVKANIDAPNADFVIRTGGQTLSYDLHKKRLQSWLVYQARQHATTAEQVAALVGISRPTLYKWGLGPRPQGKRGTHSKP